MRAKIERFFVRDLRGALPGRRGDPTRAFRFVSGSVRASPLPGLALRGGDRGLPQDARRAERFSTQQKSSSETAATCESRDRLQICAFVMVVAFDEPKPSVRGPTRCPSTSDDRRCADCHLVRPACRLRQNGAPKEGGRAIQANLSLFCALPSMACASLRTRDAPTPHVVVGRR